MTRLFLRFNAPYALFIRISMILNLFSGFCTCDEICKQPNLKTFEQVIFVNDSYRYVSNQLYANSHIQSHHYQYSQTISLNQPRPDVNGSFTKYMELKDIEPQFTWKYYENQVSKFRFFSNAIRNELIKRYFMFLMNAAVLFIQKSPDVNVVSTSTAINHEETTLGIPEVQVGGNVNETTNGNDQYSVNI
ncbi:unnamed protein product [Schistosoma curassoni]|uniref:Uncharacterized protein n=1 Tax=Schistosoma curassoni TaxID=6186 RepID=A0A183KLG9_9TREM|nr:unnamed protein product [Schistosoma curassoni]